METNKVKVKIYGQEYTIAGDMSKEEIIQVAAHVDMKMQEIAEAARDAGAVPANIAILSAINIASEYFKTLDDMEEIKRLNIQLEKDAQHYVQLWDEAKKSYSDYKEETLQMQQQKEDLMEGIRQRDNEILRLKESVESAKEQAQSGMEEVVSEIENKCRELENSFFDLQMENLQLKKELEKYKNSNQ